MTSAQQDDDLDSLYKAVGFVVVQWALAEQSLDLIVAHLFHSCGGKSVDTKSGIPRALKRKLAFVKRCLARLPALSKFKADGQALIETFSRLSEKRHDLVHGAISSLQMENGGFSFVKLDYEPEMHVARSFQFSAAQFPDLTKELVDLGAQAASFGHRLLDDI